MIILNNIFVKCKTFLILFMNSLWRMIRSIDERRIHQREISKRVRSFHVSFSRKGKRLMGKTSKDDAGEEIRVVRTRVPLFLGNEATTCIVVYFVYSAEKKQRTIRRGKPFLLNLITELINFLTTRFRI